MSIALRLKPNAAARVLGGHPWVFANEVTGLAPPGHDGEVIECRDARGRFLGTGIYNSRSQIIWRRLSRARVVLDEHYLRAALMRAIGRRKVGRDLPIPPSQDSAGSRDPAPQFQRLVWSESDDLPGVVVDQYGDALVVQTQTLAMEKRLGTLAALLDELVKPAEIIFRNDASVRRLEGLPLEVRTRSGRPWEPRWVRIGGLDYWLDLQAGQKTGFFLDQRFQHAAIERYIRCLAPDRPGGVRALDAFCNQGSFALHCARAGAAVVRGLDSAPEAVAQARRNAERNALRAEFLAVNVFDYFTERRDEAWDLIILDPPPFAKSKGALAGAMRGYKEINLRALRCLTPGGMLATYSCSHHVQDADFRAMLAAAAADAKRTAHILEFCHQPPDHPVLLTMPESEYLRGLIVRAD
ncbi:MAG TPA: class I SAM-dependent rRNA methyltransferase [Opitutaceae bacterium]|nr:class I SAM-dependent rRNA methyltransferase [Opitutaceae bacterium]